MATRDNVAIFVSLLIECDPYLTAVKPLYPYPLVRAEMPLL